MNAFDSPGYGESRPLFYVRGYGVYATTLLVATYVGALVSCSLLMAAGQRDFLGLLAFDGNSVARGGQVWRWFTYPLLQSPTVWFLLEMWLLWSFGQDVEKFFGRATFLKLYVALLVVPVLLLTGLSFVGFPSFAVGSGALHFGVFALFAFTYPGVRFCALPVTALVLLLALLAIYTLRDLAAQNPSGVFLLWTTVGLAYVGVRAAGAQGGLPFLERLQNSLPRRRPPVAARGNAIVKPRARPRRAVEAGVSVNAPAGPANASAPAARDVHESIDPLLDKIAKHGLASLSTNEKAALERARASLLRKERRE